MKTCFLILFIGSILIGDCSFVQNKKTGKNEPINGIWQLDYYPDSIFIHRNIFDYSNWSSDYAYNIQFEGDSCHFIGWQGEFPADTVLKINKVLYRTKGKDPYWEFKLVTKDKLLMREIERNHQDSIIRPYFPYHRVNKILTMDALKMRIAKKMFAGKYRVVYNDTLVTDKIVILNDTFGVKGIKGFIKFEIHPDIDIDFPLPNSFSFIDPDRKLTKQDVNLAKGFSFQFSKDTLLLEDYNIKYKDGDFDGFKITRPRMKLLRLK